MNGVSPSADDARAPGRDRLTACLADVVAAIGSAGFPTAFLAAMSRLCGAQLCSAFALSDARPPCAIFAEGDVPAFPAFAQQATLAYAQEFWRTDRTVRRLGDGTGADRVTVFRTAASGLENRRHRACCYERAGVGERLSLFRPGKPAFLANGYRRLADGGFSSEDIEEAQRAAPILLSAVARHYELGAERRSEAALSDAVRVLLATAAGLSGREAQVAAAIIHGRTHKEIGEEARLALSSVVTYRRRAYQKLGVASRRRLIERYRELRGETAL